MLSNENVQELLMNDKRFQKLSENDKNFVVEMTVGKIEEFIVNIFPDDIEE
jgi:hypothetical protein